MIFSSLVKGLRDFGNSERSFTHLTGCIVPAMLVSVPIGLALREAIFSTEKLEAKVSATISLIVRVGYVIVCIVGSNGNFHLCVC